MSKEYLCLGIEIECIGLPINGLAPPHEAHHILTLVRVSHLCTAQHPFVNRSCSNLVQI